MLPAICHQFDPNNLIKLLYRLEHLTSTCTGCTWQDFDEDHTRPPGRLGSSAGYKHKWGSHSESGELFLESRASLISIASDAFDLFVENLKVDKG